MRPIDWFPLTGGDPAPGDPDAWDRMSRFWQERCEEILQESGKLAAHLPVTGTGNRIANMNSMLTSARDLASSIAAEFDAASATAASWRAKMSDLQTTADGALRTAQDAQSALESVNSRIADLEAEAAADPAPNPVIASKLNGFLGIGGGLYGERETAASVIAEQQRVVDGVRTDYRSAAPATRSAYTIDKAGSLGAVLFPSASSAAQVIASPDVDFALLSQTFSDATKGGRSYAKLLDQLAGMSSAALAPFFPTHPSLAEYPVGVTGDTVDNTNTAKTWWGELGIEQQTALIRAAPGMIGNMEGVTYSARDKSNRNLLSQVLEDEGTSENLTNSLRSLELAATKQGGDRGVRRYITSLDLTGSRTEDDNDRNDILASIAIGNLDTATAGTFLVPGMDNDVGNSMKDLTNAAQNLYRTQNQIYADNGGRQHKHAVVGWIGYETPGPAPSPSVLNSALARAGGDRLAAAADGFNTTRSEEADLNLVAHSYGTTTTAEALQKMETKADTVTFLASAGITKQAVERANTEGQGLAVETNTKGQPEILYSLAEKDGTAPKGVFFGFRAAPSSIDGSQEFTSESGYDNTGELYERVTGHTLYFDDESQERGYLLNNTSSLYYTRLTSTGRGEFMGELAPIARSSWWNTPDPDDAEKQVDPAEHQEELKYSEEQWSQVSDGRTR